MGKVRILIILLITCYSCTEPIQKEYSNLESVWVKVDSLHVPTETKSRTQFNIEFFANLGYNRCYHLGGMIMTGSGNNIFIKVYGSFDYQSYKCSNLMVFRSHMALDPPGIYNLIIKQPDSTFLVRQIIVN
jgi:hypothetical protein